MKLSDKNLKVAIESLKSMTLHPEVQKYIQANTSKGGKVKWAKMTAEEKKAHMRMMNKASVKAKAEQKKQVWKEQFYD